MSQLTIFKSLLNRILQRLNLKIHTLTKDTIELNRLKSLINQKHFKNEVYIIPKSYKESNYSQILKSINDYFERFEDFNYSSKNEVNFTYSNDYFSSPDVEVLYTIVREKKPKNIIEVGSGYSSLIIRQAIKDGFLDTCFITIDPNPRININGIADKWIYSKVESVDKNIFNKLQENDILFIDSSHEIHVGNDVLFIYLNLLPNLPKGVFIHIHDIFLPYEYPEEWIVVNRWNWNEQYLIQTILLYSEVFEVIWPGYYLHKHLSDFNSYFKNINGRIPKSLWLLKK